MKKILLLLIITQFSVKAQNANSDFSRYGAVYDEASGVHVARTPKNLVDLASKIVGSDVSLATDYLEEALNKDPDYIDAHILRGRIYTHDENFSMAIMTFNSAWIKAPGRFDVRYYRAEAYYMKKEYDLAMKDIDSYIAHNPNFPGSYVMRGRINSDLGNYAGALKDYEKLHEFLNKGISVPMDRATFFNNKAWYLLKTNRLAEALELANLAIATDRNKGYMWDTRGEIFYALGSYQQSIADMNQAISLGSGGNSYYIRGLSKINLGQTKEGCQDLSSAAKFGHTDPFKDHPNLCVP